MLHLRCHLETLRLKLLQRRVCRSTRSCFNRDVRDDLGDFSGNLFAALGRALRLLGQTHGIHLRAMQLLLQGAGAITQLGRLAAATLNRLIGVSHREFDAVEHGLFLLQIAFEFFDFALARQHAVQFAVRCVKTHAMAGKHITVRRHQHAPRRQIHAPRHAAGGVGHGVDAVQPLMDGRRQTHVTARHMARQRFEPRVTGHCILRRGRSALLQINHGQLARRRLRQPLGGAVDALERNAIQALAQHRFECIFPPGGNFNALPQARRFIELAAGLPALHVRTARKFGLQLRQHVDTRLNRGEFLGRGVHLQLTVARGLLQPRQLQFALLQLRALLGKLCFELLHALGDLRQRGVVDCRQQIALFGQPRLPLRKLLQQTRGMAYLRLLNLQALLRLRQRALQFLALGVARAMRLLG